MEPTSPPGVANHGLRLRLLPLALAALACASAGGVLTARRASPAVAAGQTAIAIDVDPATPGIQTSVSLPEGTDPISVDIVIVNADEVGAFEFELAFNLIALQFIDWQLGPFLGSTGRVVTCSELIFENSLRIGCGTIGPSPPGASGDGVLGTLRFHPRFPGQTCLPMLLVETASVLGDPFPTTGQSACITIVPSTPTPTATATATAIPTFTPTEVPATARPSPTETARGTSTAQATVSAPAPTSTAAPGQTPGPGASATAGPGSSPAPGASTPPCPQPPTYWTTHPDAWPTDVPSLGGHGYTEDELLTLLAREAEGDGSLVLGHELIAAKLNAAMGAPMPASDIDLADGLVGEYGNKLPLGVAVETYQGQGMVWAAAALAQANRRCGGAEGASENPAPNIAGGTSSGRGPSGLPGTGGRLRFDSSKAGWIITVMSLIIGVLLVTLLRRTFEADEQ